MNAILIDDEPFSLQYLEMICENVPNLRVEKTFSNAINALNYIKSNAVDLVITDIEMPGLTGLEAIRRIREINADIGVIFVTGYEQYAFEAFQVNAVAYLTKPCRVEDVISAVQRAEVLKVRERKIEITTFGMFAVSINNIPCHFSNRKAKELLAYLVDKNGGIVSMEQLVDVLWEERSYDETVKRLYRKATAYLNHMFEGTEFFVSERAKCYIIPEKINCDYYRFLKAPEQEAENYNGEYMSQYSWAEMTNGKISRILQNRGFIK